MLSRRWLLSTLLVVPLVGFVVAQVIIADFNSELRSALREQYPRADNAALSAITFGLLCQEQDPQIRSLCSTYSYLKTMSATALCAGAGGLLLLLVIRLAGAAARHSRALLLILFKPGLYLTALALTCLVLVHAAVAMGAIYFGESELLGVVHLGIIAAIGLGALASVLAMARALFALMRRAQVFVIGIGLTQNQAPDLWKLVEHTAQRLGALQPKHIVVGLDPTFFASEADVTCLNRRLTGRTLFCSLPLMRILTTNEFSAVVGHELAHFKGTDTKFSRRFYPIYRGTASSIASLLAAGFRGWGSIPLLPAIAVLSYFLESFAIAESRIGREREIAADEAGASITDPQTIATALVKLHASSTSWQGFEHDAAQALREGKPLENASKAYAERIARAANAQAFQDILATHTTHPTDSHPSLGSRLASLAVSLDQISAASLQVKPADAAVDLVSGADGTEQEITRAYEVTLARALRIQVAPLSPQVQDRAMDHSLDLARQLQQSRELAQSRRFEEAAEVLEKALAQSPGSGLIIAGYPRQTALTQAEPISGYALLVDAAAKVRRRDLALHFLERMFDLAPQQAGHARQAARAAHLAKEASRMCKERGIEWSSWRY